MKQIIRDTMDFLSVIASDYLEKYGKKVDVNYLEKLGELNIGLKSVLDYLEKQEEPGGQVMKDHPFSEIMLIDRKIGELQDKVRIFKNSRRAYKKRIKRHRKKLVALHGQLNEKQVELDRVGTVRSKDPSVNMGISAKDLVEVFGDNTIRCNNCLMLVTKESLEGRLFHCKFIRRDDLEDEGCGKSYFLTEKQLAKVKE